MPGYTGLEVCERVKSTLETSKTPVLLTVGKMEPYRVEDGARVHADGVIVKPFEATDLLAAIEKLSEKLDSAKPAWQRDERPASPDDIETSSFQAVKADDTTENTTAERFDLSQEMQSAPAMDFASIGIEPVQHEIVSAAEMAIGAPYNFRNPNSQPTPARFPGSPLALLSKTTSPSTSMTSRSSPPPPPTQQSIRNLICPRPPMLRVRRLHL